LVLKKGKLVEEGTHESLLKNYPGGTYAKLAKLYENADVEKPRDDIGEDFNYYVKEQQDMDMPGIIDEEAIVPSLPPVLSKK